MDCPCKDCEFRHPACWSECEPYKQYKKAFDAEKLDRDKSRHAQEFLCDMYHRQMRKKRKK